MIQRGTTHTPPWQQRLAWPVALSLVLHGVVFVVQPPVVHFPSLPVEINRTVEFGLETAVPATAPTPAPTAPATPPPPPPSKPLKLSTSSSSAASDTLLVCRTQKNPRS